MFKAIQLTRNGDQFARDVVQLDDDALPTLGDGSVTLQIAYSTLNYKDALALTNSSPVVRKWPMVPGIDGAGIVTASEHPGFKPGTAVILNGWGAGETHWGCLAQKARLHGDWLIELPATLSSREAMAIGTAGYTAMLSILALEAHGISPASGEILVTGATGGVGSIAIALLSGLGYRVCASSGKPALADFLRNLGAYEVVDRTLLSAPGKPLQKERWAAVIDSVGSHTLANACAQVRYGGTVTACGLAQGMDFPASVAPFILRGVKLIGIDSVMAPFEQRMIAWRRLARDLDRGRLASITRAIGLDDSVFEAAAEMMAGRSHGRLVVDVNA